MRAKFGGPLQGVIASQVSQVAPPFLIGGGVEIMLGAGEAHGGAGAAAGMGGGAVEGGLHDVGQAGREGAPENPKMQNFQGNLHFSLATMDGYVSVDQFTDNTDYVKNLQSSRLAPPILPCHGAR